jgi:S1-C subfamily serine protease
MEDLNKTQLILITLLVSFVTSIATGIITVSLLQEAPPSVTQTINRIVQQTVEKVVPTDGSSTKEVKTVVVKEEDLVIDAINKNAKNIVRIKDETVVDGVSSFYGIGFLISKEGIMVSDRRENVSKATTYLATFADGATFQMKVFAIDEGAGLVFFQIIKDPKKSLPTNISVLASKDLQLGQTVISIEGESKNIVSIGRVVSLDFDDSVTPKTLSWIETDIISKTTVTGGPLVNLSGEVVGIRSSKTGPSATSESYIPLSSIKASMEASFKK